MNPSTPAPFLVIDLPAFPLQAVQRLTEEPPNRPAVVTESQGRQSRVIAANEAARRGQVEPGQSLAQARSRTGELRVFSRQPAAEEAAMELLFALAYIHTPFLERSANGLFTLELRGLGRRDPIQLAHALLGDLQKHGFDPRLGLAPTPDLALFTARAATREEPVRQTRAGLTGTFTQASPLPADLATLPLSAANPSPKLLSILSAWGLRHLADLVALPRAELTRRLGEEAHQLWEQASGERRRLLTRAQPPRHFRVQHELEFTLHTLEPLLFLIQRLLDSLSAQLRAATQCAREIQLTLHLDHAHPHVRSFQLPAPTARSELLFRVLHLYLEQLRTKEAVTGLALVAEPVDPPNRQQGLFHAQLKDPWKLLETQTQLVGLLGHDRVGCPQMLDTHRPDSFQMRPLPNELPPLEPEPASPPPSGRPLRRLRPHVPARVNLRNGRPVHLDHPSWRGWITQSDGPYALSGEWWQTDLFWHQTEWDVALTDGQWLRLSQQGQAWSIEGVYD